MINKKLKKKSILFPNQKKKKKEEEEKKKHRFLPYRELILMECQWTIVKIKNILFVIIKIIFKWDTKKFCGTFFYKKKKFKKGQVGQKWL